MAGGEWTGSLSEVSKMGKFRKAMLAWRHMPRRTRRRIVRKARRLLRRVRSSA